MDLILSTPVPTARARPVWVDHRAHWTELGNLQSHYVPRAKRRRRSLVMPVLLALSAAMTATAASMTAALAVVLVAFIL